MRRFLLPLLALACTSSSDTDHPADSGLDDELTPEELLCERMVTDPVRDARLDSQPLPELLVDDAVLRITLNGGGWATFKPEHVGSYMLGFSGDLTIMPLDEESYPIYPIIAQADCEGVHHFETYELSVQTYQVLFNATSLPTVDVVSMEVEDDGLSL